MYRAEDFVKIIPIEQDHAAQLVKNGKGILAGHVDERFQCMRRKRVSKHRDAPQDGLN